MAGLFGMDLFPNATQPSGGLFGGSDASAPNKWLQALSLLGATLTDVGSHGRTDALSRAQANMKAMADQAQKDAIAQRLGDAFNTQPVQAPTVNINTPAGPSPLDLTSVTNAVNGMDNSGIPKLDGKVPSVQSTIPLYAQAIGAGIDPTPYMNLQKEASKQPARILTPDEMKSYGFRPGTVGIMDENGVPRVLQASDVASPEAIKQKIDLENANPQLKLTAASQAETARHNRATEADQNSPLDPASLDYWAQSVAAGGPMPTLGMGKAAANARQQILGRVAQINGAKGLSGADQNVATGTTKANTAALSKQTQLRSATEGFENTMLQNMNVARDLIKKGGAGTTGVPVFNRWQRYVRGEYQGDPEVIKLNQAIDTIADENAKIRSGTLGNTPATDSMRENIHKGLNGAMTPDQILGAFDIMQKDSGNRTRALRAQEAALKSALHGGSDMPNIPGIKEPQASADGKTARTVIHYDAQGNPIQ